MRLNIYEANMKQKLFLISICFLLVIFYGCMKKEKTVIDKKNNISKEARGQIEILISNHFKDLRLINFRFGNFTNSGNIEILAYYNSKEITKENAKKYNVASSLYVFVIKNNKIIEEYKCEHGNYISYEFMKDKLNCGINNIVENKKLKFGEWDGYTFVSDYNKNGKDEILTFVNLPNDFVPVIMEHHKGKMETVLKIRYGYNVMEFKNGEVKSILNINKGHRSTNVLGSLVETREDKKNKFLEIFDGQLAADSESVRWEKYKWFEKEKCKR